VNEQEWQFQRGIEGVNTLVPEWRLEYTQGVPILRMLEEPGEQVWVLEYRSTNWVVDTTSSATAALWTLDAERTNLDEHLFYSELKWRFLKSKGADYSVDIANAEIQRETEIARDKGGSKILDLRGYRTVEGF